MSNCLPDLISSISQPPEIIFSVLTSKLGLSIIAQQFNQIVSSGQIPIPWSLKLHCWDETKHPQLLESFLGSLHLAWIPSDPSNPIKQAVSHNRIVDAIQSGCLVVANTMSSYVELSSVSLLTPDYAAFIDSAYIQYNRLILKHEKLRGPALARFDPGLNVAN